MTFERTNKTQTVRMTPEIHYIAKEAAWKSRVSLQKYIEKLIMRDHGIQEQLQSCFGSSGTVDDYKAER